MSTVATALPIRQRRKRAHKQPLALLVPPTQPVPRRLPRLEVVERRGPLLRPSPLADTVEDEVLSLNLMAGCPHQCTFCYARAYPSYPGDDVVCLYTNTADRLRAELNERRKLPAAVYISPSTDPFPPFLAVQEEACRVMEVLAEFGIEIWFMTRGFIRPFAMERLVLQRDTVKVTIAITTLDNDLRRTLEPLAAPPRLRLRQLAELRERGIAAQAAIDPLMPGLTDTRENLEPLVEALAHAGVEHLTTGYLFLRKGIRDNLVRELAPMGWAEPLLEPYAKGPTLAMGSIAPARHLPRDYRQRGYALLMALAASHGMTVSISSVTNPDFKPARQPAHRSDASLRQMVLQYDS